MQQEPTQPPTAIFTPMLSPAILTPTPPEAGNAIVVIEGPITNIVDNLLTINDFNVQVAPDNPILSVIDVSDVVHVVGTFDNSDVIVASVVSNVNVTEATSTNSTPVTVGLDGLVESINGTLLIVNGVPVSLEPNDPLVGKVSGIVGIALTMELMPIPEINKQLNRSSQGVNTVRKTAGSTR
jgi:hypothetical protein